MKPEDLIKTARKLAQPPERGRPLQSDLKRATSTAYYALFHAICRNCADSFVGGGLKDSRAWNQVYRSVEHGFAKKRFVDRKVMPAFPDDIQLVAAVFSNLQNKRHKADYDPAFRLSRASVQSDIWGAEYMIKKLTSAPLKDRKAFAVWTVLRKRAA